MVHTTSASFTGPAPVRTEGSATRTARNRVTALVVIALMAVSGGLVAQFQTSNARAAAMQMQSNGPFSFFPH